MKNLTYADTCLRLFTPMLIGYMLVFYAIFEGICNLFAEITKFASRQFYDDWYNSTSFDMYARKWNTPVHEFLLRHVYLESLQVGLLMLWLPSTVVNY